MPQTPILTLENVSVKLGAQPILHNINLSIHNGEQYMLTGDSGSGKTVLARTIAGQHFYSGTISASFGNPETAHRYVVLVEQQHKFKALNNTSNLYYQQRYNSFDAEDTMRAADAIGEDLSHPDVAALIQLLQLEHVLDEPLIQLSNGENKRLQLAKALLQKPKFLILDHPYLGLDTTGRSILNTILDQLSKQGLPFLLISTPHEIPDCITHVATLEKGSLVSVDLKNEYTAPEKKQVASFSPELLQQLIVPVTAEFTYAIRMVNVQVNYESKNILQHINWEVKHGEHWSVAGPNGAGKSTLLSLITGDNPKAYANEIYLFDKRRGSGESIWDIKKKIGYVSPELHLHFDAAATTFQTVASGLFDTIGLFRQLDAATEELVIQWLKLFELDKKAHRLLTMLSAGEQRLALLARALIKNPPLLILDEPCQGLDEATIARFRQLVDEVCSRSGTTLIYVSHYQSEWPECIDKHLYLQKGVATISNS
ncbi:ATP-binding cassette domain-containing protein [Pseudoflavitalea sp. G-6-1-2]|uniref:ATP-binding cassette domain-containing protein n=1 Tax=Pseudoflavitalea sp. G-6-1-2 TaxID=2728841 RepID=UPI001469D78A|nr:ATP-binding cassette domain-containing protein [Pseudoflavitalea sp. G-6-1-2]NML22004.1 ATP-binding cassette domain-containing protein [Pseudoflavitalea sp. G-6-1-2]